MYNATLRALDITAKSSFIVDDTATITICHNNVASTSYAFIISTHEHTVTIAAFEVNTFIVAYNGVVTTTTTNLACHCLRYGSMQFCS